MEIRGRVSYWVFPILSGLVWMGMLLGMLLWWIINDNSSHLPTMSDSATIAFISNIGADKLWPLFITGCTLTAIFLDLGFIAERWLRHNGRLVPNTSTGQKVLSILSLGFAAVGTVGLICLSIFRTGIYSKLHWLFLGLFILGYMLSAVFICWEYQRLGIRYREHSKLRLSFWIKLAFILVELALLIVFAVTSRLQHKDTAAIFEWIISFVFTFYAFSFAIDLYPAVHTRHPDSRWPKPSLQEKHQAGTPSNDSRSNFYQRDVEMA